MIIITSISHIASNISTNTTHIYVSAASIIAVKVTIYINTHFFSPQRNSYPFSITYAMESSSFSRTASNLSLPSRINPTYFTLHTYRYIITTIGCSILTYPECISTSLSIIPIRE